MLIDTKTNSTNITYVIRNESIDRYLNSIREYKPLSFNQENAYITAYKVDGDMKARDMLVNCNQRFVYSKAKEYSNNPDTVLELVNEGNIGLMEAIERFDFTKGCRLLTYASKYIVRNMTNYYCENRLVKRPSDIHIGSRVANERNLFYNQNEREPTIEELRSIMLNKYGVKILNDADLEVPEVMYVEGTVNEDDEQYTYDKTPEYSMATCSYNDCIKTTEQDHTKAIILTALDKIDERSANILKMLYGIDYPRDYSVSEIAQLYNMTTTRINQIRREATKKLQLLITAA